MDTDEVQTEGSRNGAMLGSDSSQSNQLNLSTTSEQQSEIKKDSWRDGDDFLMPEIMVMMMLVTLVLRISSCW